MENEVLVAVNKVQITRSKGKCYYKLNFPFEKAGTTMYFYRKNNRLFLYARKLRGTKAIFEKTIVAHKTTHSHKYETRYIQLGHLFDFDVVTHLRVIKGFDYYILEPASKEEIDAFGYKAPNPVLGKVSRNFCISLIGFESEIFKRETIEILLYRHNNASWIMLHPSEKSSFPGYKQADKTHDAICYQIGESLMETRRFLLPKTFCEQTGIIPGDILPVWKDEKSGCFVIEGKPGKCCISGEKIPRTMNVSTKMIVSEAYAEGIPKVAREIYEKWATA